MKRYRWFILVAAVLITGCEVLGSLRAKRPRPQEQADEAALTDVASSTYVSGG
jgi:hypothetical protein